jgi:hypothetical protein
MPTAAEVRAEFDSAASPLAGVYAALRASGDAQGIVDALNDTSGTGAGAINRSNVTRGELLEALAPVAGLRALYAAAANFDHPAFDLAKTATLILDDPSGALDYTRAGTRALVGALGPAGYGLLSAEQLAALAAVCTRTGSRAEVLWGEGAAVWFGLIAEALSL